MTQLQCNQLQCKRLAVEIQAKQFEEYVELQQDPPQQIHQENSAGVTLYGFSQYICLMNS